MAAELEAEIHSLAAGINKGWWGKPAKRTKADQNEMHDFQAEFMVYIKLEPA